MKKRNLKALTVLFAGILICLPLTTVLAQEYQYQDLEDLQDESVKHYMDIYSIVDAYPDFECRYVFNDGQLEKVIVDGVDNEMDKKRLEVLIFDFKQSKRKMKNIPTRTGIYYSVDKRAEPANGYYDFYMSLQSNLDYPEEAKKQGVEGNVYVKFVVDSNGDISYITASEDIETNQERFVQDLKAEAKAAIMETSGDWEPAIVNGNKVASWAIIPVVFKIEPHPAVPFIM